MVSLDLFLLKLYIRSFIFLAKKRAGLWKQAMYDLLQQKGEPGGPLMILEENNIVDIRGLAKIRVENEMETLKLFFEGEKLRSYGRHLLNQVRFFSGTTPFHKKNSRIILLSLIGSRSLLISHWLS